MQVKRLVQHVNSKAIVVDSNSGVTIQSVKPVKSKFDEAKKHVFKEYADLFKNLSDR